MTSHAKTYTNGFPFSNGNPFTSRFSSVQLKFASVRTAWVIRSKRKSIRSNGCVIRSQKLPNRSNGSASVWAVWSSVHKNHPSVRMACAIRSEILSIRSNGCGTRSEKFASVRMTWSSVQKNYPSVQNFDQLEPFVQTPWIIIYAVQMALWPVICETKTRNGSLRNLVLAVLRYFLSFFSFCFTRLPQLLSWKRVPLIPGKLLRNYWWKWRFNSFNDPLPESRETVYQTKRKGFYQ